MLTSQVFWVLALMLVLLTLVSGTLVTVLVLVVKDQRKAYLDLWLMTKQQTLLLMSRDPMTVASLAAATTSLTSPSDPYIPTGTDADEETIRRLLSRGGEDDDVAAEVREFF